MNIETIPISSLIPDPNNARQHDDKNLSAIKGSLAKFGQQKPIVIDDKNVVIAGNGTLDSAKELGWTEIACVRSDLKTITEKTAFALADNRTSELANWDMEVLGKELLSLQEDDFDIGEIGFDPADFEPKELPDIDGAKELNASDFDNFDHQCPKCGFEWDDNKSASNGPMESDGPQDG